VKESLRPSLSSLFRFTTRHRFDWLNPACMIVLTIIGIAFIYSANLATGRTQWSQQIVWIVAGGCLYIAVSMADYKLWLKLAHWIYAGCLVLLLWPAAVRERGPPPPVPAMCYRVDSLTTARPE
jgi:rod shape determining protein RodA